MPDARANGLRWLGLAALAIVLDQITKLAVAAKLTAYQDVIPVTSFFNLVHVHNTGAAFSLFANQGGWQKAFFLSVALVASAAIFLLLRKPGGRIVYYAALALILGGALGNVIDRLAYGHVIDFLDFYVGAWHWPAFNVADSAITLGAALLIWDGFRHDPGKDKA